MGGPENSAKRADGVNTKLDNEGRWGTTKIDKEGRRRDYKTRQRRQMGGIQNSEMRADGGAKKRDNAGRWGG